MNDNSPEGHSYRVMLTTGQYLRLLVEQKGIDVIVRLLGPDGQKLREVDNGSTGKETVFMVVESSGEYRVEVRPADKDAPGGSYEIGIAELREAKARDSVALAALKLFESGNQLRDERTAESRRKAIKKYEESLPLWRDAGDQTGEAQTLNEMGIIYSNLSEPQKAIEVDDQAILLWQAVGDRSNEATTLTNAGVVHWRAGQLEKSLEYHGRAMSVAKEAGDKRTEALTLSNTGAVYGSMGQPLEALKCCFCIRVCGDDN